MPTLRSTATIELKNGVLTVVGGVMQSFADLDFLVPQEGGYCVVNSWGTALPESAVLSISKTWVAPTGEVAVILVDLEVSTPNGPRSEWLVLATDGQRLWNAVENAKALHLLVPKAELRVTQGQLQLALTNKYVTARLRPAQRPLRGAEVASHGEHCEA